MADRALTEREVTLLRIVAAGPGKRSTREIDWILSVHYGPVMVGPVMNDLRWLEGMGFVDFDLGTGTFGSWSLTAKARSYLEVP